MIATPARKARMYALTLKHDSPLALTWQQHFELSAHHHDLSQKHRTESLRLRDAADPKLSAVHAGLSEEHLVKATAHASEGIRGNAADQAMNPPVRNLQAGLEKLALQQKNIPAIDQTASASGDVRLRRRAND